MKKLVLVFFVVSAMSYTATAQEQQVAVQHDKQFMLDYYRQTLDELEQAFEGLSEAQLSFQASPDKWSISQCLEHIAATENALLGYAKKTMEQSPNAERRSEVKTTDEGIIQGMTDRSSKAKAPEELAPQEAGKYTDAGVAINDLKEQRKVVLSYINGLSEEDMRSRVTDSPFGPIDGYHSLLLIPAHTARHTLQIEEVKASPDFPGK
jgi:Protein of unknown function (DUF664).